MSELEVIGAGLPRTGTLSTRAALEKLLGPCYHGATTNGLNGRQNKALNAGEVAAVEFFNSHIEEVRNDLNALK